MNRPIATFVGFSAIVMWSFLALLTTLAGQIPPFELAAITFLLGGLSGAATWIARPHAFASLRQPLPVWLLGIAGLCIYHSLYFFAIQTAPPLEVSLIAYLWPLLIVLFAALLPGERLRKHHLLGAVMGFLGAVLIITKGGSVGLLGGMKTGHAAALACAFIWSGYSVLSRRFGHVPTDVVAGYCLITAIITFLLHLRFEATVWPQSIEQWGAIVLLGVFPLGAAFYAWDHGVKHGDIMVLGALSYLAPPLSVLVLLAVGRGAFHWSIGAACLLITLGALVASKDVVSKRRGPAPAGGSRD